MTKVDNSIVVSRWHGQGHELYDDSNSSPKSQDLDHVKRLVAIGNVSRITGRWERRFSNRAFSVRTVD